MLPKPCTFYASVAFTRLELFLCDVPVFYSGYNSLPFSFRKVYSLARPVLLVEHGVKIKPSFPPPFGGLFTDWVFITTLFVVFKVYYLPFGTFHNQCALPTLYTTLPLMRCIFLREKITIVHGHSVSLQIIFFFVDVVLLIMRAPCDIHCIIDKLQDSPLLCLHL